MPILDYELDKILDVKKEGNLFRIFWKQGDPKGILMKELSVSEERLIQLFLQEKFSTNTHFDNFTFKI